MRDGLQIYRRIFANKPGATRKPLDRGSLPTPLQYLAGRDLLKRTPRGEWVGIVCPVHKGGTESNPSLRVNLVDGHFKCLACGVKGGDVVALHQLISGVSFLDALRDLGARFYE